MYNYVSKKCSREERSLAANSSKSVGLEVDPDADSIARFLSRRDISRGRFGDKAPVGRRERSRVEGGVDWPPIAKRSGKPRSSLGWYAVGG